MTAPVSATTATVPRRTAAAQRERLILFIALIATSVHQVDHFGPSVQFCMNSRNC